jgi:hypothetical protein
MRARKESSSETIFPLRAVNLKLAERAVHHVVIDKKPRRRAQRREVEG